jgi:8-oxo-dGTP diphosphatase
MNLKKELEDFILNGHQRYVPHLSIDCAILGYHESQLKILLNRWQGMENWCLPGGYVLRTESIDAAAVRILKGRTGLEQLFLQQFHTFGEPGRHIMKSFRSKPRKGDESKPGAEMFRLIRESNSWMQDRMISIGYYALVEYSQAEPRPDLLSEECRWWDIHELPELLFDHRMIAETALKALRTHLSFQPVGYNLLPRKFTFPELIGLYETILEKRLDRRNFQKKIEGLGILERLEERRNIGPHRAPYLYRFNKKVYDKALTEGIIFGF